MLDKRHQSEVFSSSGPSGNGGVEHRLDQGSKRSEMDPVGLGWIRSSF